MNWYVHGVHPQVVGEEPDEGGHCEHLKKGDVAYGYSGEADSFGEERYLKCKPCYEAFLLHRKTEPLECDDCGNEFSRNTMYRYIPYIMDGSPSENEDSKRWICKGCQTQDRHLRRMENDKYLREQDQDDDDFLLPEDDDDIDDLVLEDQHQCTGMYCKGCEIEYGPGYWDCTVYVKGRVSGIRPGVERWSRCIERIVVGARKNG